MVDRERRRYSGSAWRRLVGELRSRFLTQRLPTGPGWVLELGPGPGRFTPEILGSGARVVAVDLSLPMLRGLGRRLPAQRGGGRLRRVRAAGEHLPFGEGAFRAAVAYGNLLGFAGYDGGRLLGELARVVRPGGVLLLDVASPAAATSEFLSLAAEQRLLRRVLRDPDFFFLTNVASPVDRIHLPYAPKRLQYWEFDFYTPRGAEEALNRSGFRTADRMAVGAIAAYRERIAAIARRDPRAWRNLIATEEKVGRRTGVLEAGHGFVIAAVRDRSRPRRRPRGRPQLSYRTPRSRAAHVLS